MTKNKTKRQDAGDSKQSPHDAVKRERERCENQPILSPFNRFNAVDTDKYDLPVVDSPQTERN